MADPKDVMFWTSGPVMLWTAGESRHGEHFNKAWLEFRGRTMEEETGTGWLEGIHPDDRDRAELVYELSFCARQPFTLQYRLRRFDGLYRWVVDNGIPRQQPDGTFAGFMGGCIDITEQRESEIARRKLSAMLISAQEKERSTIARELHDHISQRLALISIEIQRFAVSSPMLSDEQQVELDRLYEMSAAVARDVQALSHQLHSSQLELLGLSTAVRSLCDEFTRATGIRATCSITGTPEMTTHELALAFFRIAQESFRNAEQYSKAKKIAVKLEWKPDSLSLSVLDDGLGFDTSVEIGTGLGLISMRERIQLIGGALEILSSPGKGTRILARAPLSNAA